jgi:hypothetical protein
VLTRYIRWRTSTPACTPARAAGHVMLQAAHSSWPKHQDLHSKSSPNLLPHGNTVTTGCWQGPSSPSNNACLLRLQHRTRAVLNGAYANTPLARHIAQDVAGQPQTTARCSQHLDHNRVERLARKTSLQGVVYTECAACCKHTKECSTCITCRSAQEGKGYAASPE